MSPGRPAARPREIVQHGRAAAHVAGEDVAGPSCCPAPRNRTTWQRCRPRTVQHADEGVPGHKNAMAAIRQPTSPLTRGQWRSMRDQTEGMIGCYVGVTEIFSCMSICCSTAWRAICLAVCKLIKWHGRRWSRTRRSRSM